MVYAIDSVLRNPEMREDLGGWLGGMPPGGFFLSLHVTNLYGNRGFTMLAFSGGYRKWDNKAESLMILATSNLRKGNQEMNVNIGLSHRNPMETIMPYRRMLIILLLLAGLTLIALSGCSGRSSGNLPMGTLDQMPAEVQDSPTVVRQAYQFAVANPDVMRRIPCYCGCGPIGHTSNYSCYVSRVDDQGHVTFDTHALGCSICVDITQDTMRLLQQGKSVDEIRAYVDTTYSKYGKSNMPGSP
jgi:hypothetical protein